MDVNIIPIPGGTESSMSLCNDSKVPLKSEVPYAFEITSNSLNEKGVTRDVDGSTTPSCTSLCGPFTCNGCGVTFDTSCSLHAHMIDHSDGSYHYDHIIKTAFPKYDSCCIGTQTTKMDKKYLRNYSRSRTGKPPKTVSNVKVKSEVRDNFILLNMDDSDEQIPLPVEQDNKINPARYQFRTSTRVNRLSFQDCFVKLNDFEILDLEKNSDNCRIKKKIPIKSMKKMSYTNVKKEPKDAPTESTFNVDPIKAKNMKRERSHDTESDPDYDADDDPVYDVVDDDDSDADYLPYVNGDSESDTGNSNKTRHDEMAQTVEHGNRELDNNTTATDTQQTIKRKRGRPRKIKEGECNTSINGNELISSNDNVNIEETLPTETQNETTEMLIPESDDKMLPNDVDPPKRKRGRPRKTPADEGQCSTMNNVKDISRFKNTDTVRKQSKEKQIDKTLVNPDMHLDTEPCTTKPDKHDKPISKKSTKKIRKKLSTFICHICGLTPWSTRKEVHMNKHLGLKPYICDVCAKSFYCRNSFALHKKYHDKEKGLARFRCKICDKIYIQEHEYLNHMYTHSSEKPFKCGQCPSSFSSPRLVKKHIERVHEKRKNVKCSECDRMFYSAGSMRTHYVVNHAEPTLPCKFCGRLFSVHKVRRNHERTHTGEKEYYCCVCKHGFIQWSPYLTHMMKQHGYSREYVFEMKKIQKQQKQTSRSDIIVPLQEIQKILGQSELTSFQKQESNNTVKSDTVPQEETIQQLQHETGLKHEKEITAIISS